MRYLLAVLSVTCCFSARPVSAGDCPVTGPEERVAIIAKARTCQKAAELCRRCAIGGMLDVRLANSVYEVCDKTVLSKLTEQEHQAYKAATDACYAPHEGKRGTIHQSAPAHCWVDVMAGFAKGR
jgi:hypothetical protein